MMCVGHYKIKPFVHKKIIEENECLHTNSRLENGLMYLY